MIKIVNLNKVYKLSNKKEVNALEDINLTFPDTGFYSIIGRSGAGKTTLLNCLAGIDQVTSGEIYFDDVDICKLKGIQIDNYRRNVGFIFQDYNLLKEYDVEKNIAISMDIQEFPKDKITETVNEVLKKVGLEGYNKRKIIELSGGEQQRVVIARALAKRSKIILCDEPTGNLDEETAIELFTILKKISKDVLVINVTHNKTLARKYSDATIEIGHGKIIDNPLSELDIIPNTIQDKSTDKTNFGFPFIFRLGLEHFKHTILISIIILIMFIGSFSILTLFQTLGSYDATDSYISYIKKNDKTIVPIVNYIDHVEKKDTIWGRDYIYGLEVNYRENTDLDLWKLKFDLSGKAKLYQSYYYLKGFDSLFNVEYQYDLRYQCDFLYYNYHPFEFDEIIVVNDFNDFNACLLYGHNPKEANEILIYDYMADSLLNFKCFDCEMNELIGKTFNDQAQNIEFKIAGILKSDYLDHQYDESQDYSTMLLDVEYLSSFKSMFVTKELFNKIKAETKTITNAYVELTMDDESIYNSLDNKNHLSVIESKSLDFIYKSDENYCGVILTKTQFLNFLGINYTPTDDKVAELINNFDEDLISIYFNDVHVYSGESEYDFEWFNIYGIVSDEDIDKLNDDTAIYLTASYDGDYDYEYYNNYISSFDKEETGKYYLEFNSDYKYAEEVIEYLNYPYHDDDYYEDCVKNDILYCNEGYCINDQFYLLLEISNEYYDNIEMVSNIAVLISIIIIVISIFELCFLSIKKQGYKIGILKSLGAKNYQIELSYIFYVIIIAVAACILSIPFSYYELNEINTTLKYTLDYGDIDFFKISNINIYITLLLTFVVSLLGSLVTYVIFTIKSPVTLIRHNKDR